MRSSDFPAASRPVAMGANGMVSSAHPLASLAGLRVLQRGGNAFDAVVATASTLNVVEPYMSGVGGIGVALAHVAREGRVRAIDFSGRAPLAAEPERFEEESKDDGILAAMVPGNLSGWLTMHEEYGSLDREPLFDQAIDYATNGFPVTNFNSEVFALSADMMRRFPSADIILGSSDSPPRPGDRLTMPQLAESFRIIAKEGLPAFYGGDLGRRIVRGNQELGGIYSDEDLESYSAQWHEPISVDYKGYRVYTAPPNCSAFQVLQTLKTLEGFGPDERRFQEAGSQHLLIESAKLAIADRVTWAGDPDYVTAPLAGLLSDGYAAKQRARIDPESAAIVPGERYATDRPIGALTPGSPHEFDGGMTTHFAVADRDGNVVSVTQTLGGGFGSGAAVGGTGIFLNNMASYFELEESSPNRIGPGKRVDFVVAPTQTFRDGKFFVSMGTPGSWGILQTTPQFLTNVLDHGMNVQQAIDSPRFRVSTERNVDMEERFPLHVRTALEAKGHAVNVLPAWSRTVGGAHGIQFNADAGTFEGGADPRRDGYALGY